MHGSLPAVAPFAALLALMYIALAVRVVRLRRRHQVGLGTQGIEPLERAVRAHANFGEYTPFALLMITLCALLAASSVLITFLGILFTLGRMLHAYSLSVDEPAHGRFRFRIAGMVCSFTTLGITAAFLCWQWFTLS